MSQLKSEADRAAAYGKKLRHSKADNFMTKEEVKKAAQLKKQSRKKVYVEAAAAAAAAEVRRNLIPNEDQNIGTESLDFGLQIAGDVGDVAISATRNVYSKKMHGRKNNPNAKGKTKENPYASKLSKSPMKKEFEEAASNSCGSSEQNHDSLWKSYSVRFLQHNLLESAFLLLWKNQLGRIFMFERLDKECGGSMYCCRHNKAVRYFCSAKILKKDCNPKYIPDTMINDEVLRVVHTHINVYTDNVEMIRRLNGKKENCLQFEVFSKEVRRLQRELDKITAMKNDLYEDYVAHLIDAEQYLTIKAENLDKEEKLKASLEEMLVEKNRVSVNYKTNEEWDALINSIRDKRILTKKMVDALVSRVVVDRNFNIEVELVYDDMLKDLATYAKEREAKDGSK